MHQTSPSALPIEEIQSGEKLTFRGKQLAPLNEGIRDLVSKVIKSNDTANFWDFALVWMLCQDFEATPIPFSDEERRRLILQMKGVTAFERRIENRKFLLIATEDVITFRARLSVEFDSVTSAEVDEIYVLSRKLRGVKEETLDEVSKASLLNGIDAIRERVLAPIPAIPNSDAGKLSGAEDTHGGHESALLKIPA